MVAQDRAYQSGPEKILDSLLVPDRIEINLSTLVFIGVCGDGALFLDGDGDEVLFRVTGNRYDQKAAARELRKAATILEEAL